jgi:hypothetical protein
MSDAKVERLLGPPLKKVPWWQPGVWGQPTDVNRLYTDCRPGFADYWKRNVLMNDGKVIQVEAPALLWPMPVLVAIIGIGSIPLWAGALLGDIGFATVWIAQAALVIAVGVLRKAGWRRAKRAMGTAWGIIAAINLVLWLMFGPRFD